MIVNGYLCVPNVTESAREIPCQNQISGKRDLDVIDSIDTLVHSTNT